MTYFALVRLRLCLTPMRHVNSTTSSLDKRSHPILHGQLHPLVEVQMQDEHLVEIGAVLGLTAIDNHTLKVHTGAVVLARDHREPFGFEHVNMHFVDVEDDHLVGALTHLPLFVEHEAASEGEDFIEVGY